MKTRSLLLVSAAASFAAVVAGCFDGPSSDIPKLHRGNDIPVVFVTAPAAAVSSRTFDVQFSLFDFDSSNVILWDRCPYPGADPEYGGAPILRISFSDDGGSTFGKIDPAHLQIDGVDLVVPTCGQVASFHDDIKYTASATSNGEIHVLTWDSLLDVPEAGDVVIRIAANDNSFTSDPGDSAVFDVANAPAFSTQFQGSRPGDVLSVDLSGLLTHWGATTTTGASDNISLSALSFTSTTTGTATLTHGSDTDQILRTYNVVTPDADVPDPPAGDEIAKGAHWTCAPLGDDVEEFEAFPPDELLQFICDQNSMDLTGSLTEADVDFYEYVASSSGDAAISLDWNSAQSGADTDYDIYIYDKSVDVGACADLNTGCDCLTIAKPELCTAAGLVAGNHYIIFVSWYAGEETDYTLTVTGP